MKRTAGEVLADNCLGLAAQLAYYFFLALFPALLFIVAIISFIPVAGLLDAITGMLARVAPGEVLSIVQDQILEDRPRQERRAADHRHARHDLEHLVRRDRHHRHAESGLRHSGEPAWWKVRLLALGLTLGLALFIVVSFALVLVGPTLAEKVAVWLHMGPAFAWTWKILQWPVVFGLVALAIAMIYYYAPDAEQEWIWITPGSILATILWLLISLGVQVLRRPTSRRTTRPTARSAASSS